ncbi:hypothetical protein PENTCL1PPCAC_15947, partial [Pristionchus entomophagus]
YSCFVPAAKKDLDPSFHTLMINTTIVNILFALDCCLIQEPSAHGIFFEFYDVMGPYFAKFELIKVTVLPLFGCIVHLILAINRFSVISFPLKHQKWWQGRKLFWFCVVMWIAALCFAIPILLPGSSAHTIGTNLFGVKCVEYMFLGNYFLIYSYGGSFGNMALEIICVLFYIAMLFQSRKFIKYTQSGAVEIRKMTKGVLRTTMAACCISMGTAVWYRVVLLRAWFLVVFMIILYISIWTNMGRPILIGNLFSAPFNFLYAINNVLTPWVMLISFENVR